MNFKRYSKIRDHQFSIFEDYARKNGLNGKSLLVLLWLYNSKEHLTQERLAKLTYSSKQVIQAIVKNFIEKQLAYLQNCEKDKRKKYVSLTYQGQEFAKKIIKPLDEIEKEAMSVLSEQEQELLVSLSEKYTNNLSEIFSREQLIFNSVDEKNEVDEVSNNV